jgi:hypothetical protein
LELALSLAELFEKAMEERERERWVLGGSSYTIPKKSIEIVRLFLYYSTFCWGA